MKINKLQLVNFRNYDHCSVAFDKMVTVFYGKNGQGKTNILESIFYSSFGLSHRTNKEDEMVKFSSEGMAVLLDFTKEDGSHSIRMKRYTDNGKTRKEIKIDGKKTTAKDHYSFLNTVMFSPEDLQIIKGDPSLRRRFMDMEISQTDPVYYELLVRYRRVLKQRNSLLKGIRDSNEPQQPLAAWDEEISDTGAQILIKRLHNLKKLKEIAIPVFHILSNKIDLLEIKYEMKGNNGEVFYPEEETLQGIKEFYMGSLKERRFKDIMQGSTGIGVHRDDLKTYINGVDSRAFASQGQQRCCALALKLSQIEYVKKVSGEYPVLLLDDVMSELDQYRRNQLISFINDKVQTIITVNDKTLIPDFGSNQYFNVDKGSITLN
ncbi:MAG TPA: DNA replication/repair protein RecF [Acidaminococcaceae bacterium]|nr:DNA replication/repair protein RecF [Acidaminococcaceae bacterium]